MPIQTIIPHELAELQRRGRPVDLLDVRTPAEFREIHAQGARLLPLDQLDAQQVIQSRNGTAGEPLYVICKSGNRARQAAERFIAAGYENVVNVEGGTEAWAKAGLPVVRGAKTISLERQVRIAAGFLVLLGSVLAFFVHPYFLIVPAFVGAGLMFAGITATCGMAMLLAKMPWNNVQVDDRWPTSATCQQTDADQPKATCCH